jgi:tagaturonate reductase
MKDLNRQTSPNRQYTERIIQFGEGNFLRAFIDWIVWNMNDKAGFDGSAVAVQPIPDGTVDTLNAQNGLYHLILKGMDKGKPVYTIQMIDVISRGINPYTQFDEYLGLAENPDMRFVISNTTEAGIAFDPENKFDSRPAGSYPGKLVQLLYHRYKTFNGAEDRGFIIFPCELVFENGKALKACIDKYIEHWGLDSDFGSWVNRCCPIYSTLVDRIVPGYPHETAGEIRKQTGFNDRLMTEGEIFHLWVIEAPESAAQEFPAGKAGLNVMFVPSEQPYHERKVTLLNGTHTVLSPVGYLSGLNTVRECAVDETVGAYIRKVMYGELLPTLNLPEGELLRFAGDTLNRFCNPFIRHNLTNIMLNSFPKYKTRNLPGLKTYFKQKGCLPEGLVLGLAAIITYYGGGKRGTDEITVQDDSKTASLLQSLWKTQSMERIAKGVLAAKFIWDEDLNEIHGLADKVTYCLAEIREKGMRETVKKMLKNS